MHKGNIQKFTEGAFRNWGYELVREEFSDVAVSWDDCGGQPGDKILVKDNIADITLQQVLTRPDDFDVIATTNLNGDYLSDALAAQVGGIGIAPGANINYVTGHGIFEATHGTAPKYAGPGQGQPGLGAAVGRHDVRAPGLAAGRRRHRRGHAGDHRRQDRDLRLRPPDGRRHRSQDVRVRQRHRRPPVALGTRVQAAGPGQPPVPSPGPPIREVERRKLPAKGQHGAMKIRFAVSSGIYESNLEAFGDEVRRIEALGFDTVWLSDIPLGATLDPIVGLSFAAAATSTLKLGANVVPIGRNPLTLAKSLAQIDQIVARAAAVELRGRRRPTRRAPGARRGAGANRGRLIEEMTPLLRAWWAGESGHLRAASGTTSATCRLRGRS